MSQENKRLKEINAELLDAATFALDVDTLPISEFTAKYGGGMYKTESIEKLAAAIAKARRES